MAPLRPPPSTLFATLLLCLSAGLPTTQAQPRPADPTDPQARVPPLRHDSTLQRYRPWQDAPAADWPGANDRAHRAGGWRAYAREKSASEPGPPAVEGKPR